MSPLFNHHHHYPFPIFFITLINSVSIIYVFMIYSIAYYKYLLNPTYVACKMIMETHGLFLLSFLLLPLLLPTASAQLRSDFYKNTCPNVESLVQSAVTKKFQQTFVTVPATLRLFFHDCFVRVCSLANYIFNLVQTILWFLSFLNEFFFFWLV